MTFGVCHFLLNNTIFSNCLFLKTFDQTGFCTMRLIFDKIASGYRWSNVQIDRKADDGLLMQFTLTQDEFPTHSMLFTLPPGGCLKITWYDRDLTLANIRHWTNNLGHLIPSVPCKLFFFFFF